MSESVVPVTELSADERRARIAKLQVERDALSEQLQAVEADVAQFPHQYRLIGPVPDSGSWFDHLQAEGNEQTAKLYETLQAQRGHIRTAIDTNMQIARHLEAT